MKKRKKSYRKKLLELIAKDATQDGDTKAVDERYKSKLSDEIYKEVIAFANIDGGVIYVGIDDQSSVVGIEDVDESYTRFTNEIWDAIHLDVTMFVCYILQEDKVICIEVGEGSYKAILSKI